MDEARVGHEASVPSDDQAAEVAEPCEETFDLPSAAVPSKGSSILDDVLARGVPGGDEFDSPPSEALSESVAVVRGVANQSLRLLPGSALMRARDSYSRERSLGESDFARTRALKVETNW